MIKGTSQWKRNCPTCGRELYYSRNCSWNKSIRLNSKCNSCSQMGKLNHLYGKSAWNNGIPHSLETPFVKIIL